MANHPARSRAPSSEGAVVSRRALNLDYALAHDAEVQRDDQTRANVWRNFRAEMPEASREWLGDAWHEISALNRQHGRDIPLGTTLTIDRGGDLAARVRRLTLRNSGWHDDGDALHSSDLRPLPEADTPPTWRTERAETVLRLPTGAGYRVRWSLSAGLSLTPLPFEDALAHLARS